MKKVWAILVMAVTVACVSSAKKPQTTELLEEDWQDLITATPTEFKPQPHQRFQLIVTDEMIASLPENVRGKPALGYLTLTRFLSKPEILGDGVFGRVDGAGRFAALLADVPDWDHLYWAQVEVLSKKYACFIRKIAKNDAEMTFTCRDDRYVKMWRERGDNWIEFYSRLYGKNGQEIRRAH